MFKFLSPCFGLSTLLLCIYHDQDAELASQDTRGPGGGDKPGIKYREHYPDKGHHHAQARAHTRTLREKAPSLAAPEAQSGLSQTGLQPAPLGGTLTVREGVPRVNKNLSKGRSYCETQGPRRDPETWPAAKTGLLQSGHCFI